MTKSETLAYVGQISQLARALPFEFTDGVERGTRGILLQNAAGLSLTVHPDRCLDIGAASYNGVALAWTSAQGFGPPSALEPDAKNWLRSFGGGLVATCGLMNAGAPTDDAWGKVGLHGRIGHAPASDVTYGGKWNGDEYELVVTGTMREAVVFGEHYVLRRTLTMPMHSAKFTLEDVVTSEGHEPTPLLLLYHCNFGYPLLSETARIEGDFASVTPRDAEAEEGKEHALTFDAPTPGYKEKVYWLDPKAGDDGKVAVSLVNPAVNMRATLTYDKTELPCLTEWKQMGQGVYTVGLEPANVLPTGRASYLERGDCPMLAPGESRRFAFEISVSPL